MALNATGLAVCSAIAGKSLSANADDALNDITPPPVEEGHTRESQVAWYFANGTCGAQALLATYADLFGLSRETALKIGCGFSGGIGLTGETCSFIVGATVLLGLKNGPQNVKQRNEYENTVELSKQLVKDFKQTHKTVVCREIIQYDISTPEAYTKAHDLHVFKICDQCLKTVVHLLENKYDIFNRMKG